MVICRSLRFLFLVLVLGISLSACGNATPEPIVAAPGEEFALSVGQSVAVGDTGLTIRLVSISGDERCPSRIECAMSGPVTLTITVQSGSDTPTEFILQTFTGNDGRAPEGTFQGIQSSVDFGGYLIRVTGVLPYPETLSDRKKLDNYSVSFLVTDE